ncbi:MAG: TnpV protein, partial [Faecousia sp.]
AMLRESYLQEHRHSLYLNLLTSGQLNQHLMEVQNRASQMLEDLMPKLQQEAGVTEALKASAPMTWVGLMNNLRHSAEETILTELVYS